MRKLTECARCKRKPTVVPVGQSSSWQCVAAAPDSVDFSAPNVSSASGGHARIGGVSGNTQNYASMCRTPDTPPGVSVRVSTPNRLRRPTSNGRARASTPSASVHPDNIDRVKMECHVCGYKSFPQWMNDKAHCLKCDAVLKSRPNCQQRQSRFRTAAMSCMNMQDASTWQTPTRAESDAAGGQNNDRELSPARLPNLLSTSGTRRSNSKPRIFGPERFFYDKNSYTGTHACGGPDHVAKGGGTVGSQFWRRSSA